MEVISHPLWGQDKPPRLQTKATYANPGCFPKPKRPVAGQLKAVGLDTELTLTEGGAFVQARTAGNYNIYVTGMAIWDPDQFMERRIRGDVFKSGYKNQKVSDLILEGRTTVDQAKRAEIYKRAQEILYEESPMVWLYQMEIVYGLKKSLNGFTVYLFKVWDLRKAEVV